MVALHTLIMTNLYLNEIEHTPKQCGVLRSLPTTLLGFLVSPAEIPLGLHFRNNMVVVVNFGVFFLLCFQCMATKKKRKNII